MHLRSVAVILTVAVCAAQSTAAPQKVITLRTPHEGIAPQAASDRDNTVHVVYFKPARGDRGDLFYVRSRDGGKTFSAPIRVNTQPNVAMSVRHARMALGRNGRVHVVWNGAGAAGGEGTPLLYARLSDDGNSFEPQRNLMRRTRILDGGGTIAADGEGNVYGIWHALPDDAAPGEQNRRVWVARSSDDGKSFADEAAAWDQPTGACGCCYVGAYTDHDSVYILYRAAETAIERDMFLLTSTDKGKSFTGAKVDRWPTSACPMSAAALARTKTGVVAGWETEGRVLFGAITSKATAPHSISAPGDGTGRKYPAIASNVRGESIHAWTEGMAWKRGGTAAWQVYDAEGQPVGQAGRAEGVPADGAVAVFARADGTFIVMY